ncbi:MAG: hydrogenase expression/formation C-terminal domain-containing protein [Thiohalophilus sp.]|uniref:hydrogenase expression/formation C-terminal domain-containing protein n=1 Tax=Thiohalophilus sp. TaxID=3028392 RepID=UPI00286FD3B6|nr:hydrogenase expression/formation C-terminal domain-containing protein [Thiohalophilus sp.]MDR9435794.1 hydrogenase expression/formation C-terminal domain-containing protein [Thiohalophilus sp.]
MSKLDEISVSIEPPASPSQVRAILTELQTKLDSLAKQGITDSVDLRSLPMFPGDYELLKETLGYGEIHISIDAMGPTEIYETAFPGIWWITHSNSDDENIAEFIEITTLPAILKTADGDLQHASQQLLQLIDNDTDIESNLNRE